MTVTFTITKIQLLSRSHHTHTLSWKPMGPDVEVERAGAPGTGVNSWSENRAPWSKTRYFFWSLLLKSLLIHYAHGGGNTFMNAGLSLRTGSGPSSNPGHGPNLAQIWFEIHSYYSICGIL